MKKVYFSEISGNSLGYLALVAGLGLLVLLGLAAFWYMEYNGHWVTGMNDQVVWGIPHVFAVFLIVAASGALNVASISSVFSKTAYKPLARLSGLLALALLAGGLMVLVLDLGRPDRLIIAMTKYNFKSIFAWNIYLYTGFFVVVIVYLWMMMERKMNKYTHAAGTAAFIWRLTLTTGTGSIFGFIVARQFYDSAIYAPMFIIMSFSFGLAIFILMLMAIYGGTGRPLGDAILFRLKNLLGVFVAAVLFMVIIFFLTALYATEHHDVVRFILSGDNIYTKLFWVVQVILGSLVPIAIFYNPVTGTSRAWIAIGSILVILGGFVQIFVIIVGGQAFPLVLFPGMEVSSSFYDGVVGSYTPSLPEFLLGIGGVAVALIIVTLALKVLQFTPNSLADEDVDPHYVKAK
ncbi:MAG: polysulfide reductase NrfD [Gammaproteobacteria bacterium]|nr:polysulfide reductase NrfD [Gammaproteobacteria bacterium]